MECECLFDGRCVHVMLLSSRKDWLSLTRDFYHGISPFVALLYGIRSDIVSIERIDALLRLMRWFVHVEFGYSPHRKVTAIIGR